LYMNIFNIRTIKNQMLKDGFLKHIWRMQKKQLMYS
jgi:hypothetical protein